MRRIIPLIILASLVPAGAWETETHRWFYNQSAGSANCTFDDSRLFEDLRNPSLDILNSLNRTCNELAGGSYHYLALAEPKSDCSGRMAKRVDDYLSAGLSFNFTDCGVSVSSVQLQRWAETYSEAFLAGENLANPRKIVEKPPNPYIPPWNGSQTHSSSGQVNESGLDGAGGVWYTASTMLSKPFSFFFLGWHSNFPIFLMWFWIPFLIWSWYFGRKPKEAPFAQTYVDHEKHQYYRGTWWSTVVAQMKLTFLFWAGTLVILAIMAFIVESAL